MGQIFWSSVYFQFLSENYCITSTLPLCKPLQVQWGKTHIIFLPSMDSKSYSSNLSSFVQPPVIGPPFKLVSGEDFSAPSRVLWRCRGLIIQIRMWSESIIFFSPRIISLFGHSIRTDGLCHGFSLRCMNFYFSKSMNDFFWTESLFGHWTSLGFKFKKKYSLNLWINFKGAVQFTALMCLTLEIEIPISFIKKIWP